MKPKNQNVKCTNAHLVSLSHRLGRTPTNDEIVLFNVLETLILQESRLSAEQTCLDWSPREYFASLKSSLDYECRFFLRLLHRWFCKFRLIHFSSVRQ